MTKLEIEVDDKTAADLETAETMFCAWVRAKTEKEKEAIIDKTTKVFRDNPIALLIHKLRPPKLFLNHDEKFASDPSIDKLFK